MRVIEIIKKTNPTYFRHRFKKLRAAWYRYRDRRLYTHACFNHPLINIDRKQYVNEGPGGEFSDELLKRVCSIYEKGSQNYSVVGDIWQENEKRTAAYIDALKRNDLPFLRSCFENILIGDLLEGMAHANGIVIDEERNPYTPDYFMLRVADTLLSLGEAVGCYQVHSFAQMSLQQYIGHVNPAFEQLIEDIESHLGFSIGMPTDGNPPVIQAGAKKLNPDSIQHAYTAFRIRETLRDVSNPRILEIGGGYGMTALMSHRAGLRNYLIADLPFVSSFQLGYLGSVLGSDRVASHADPDFKLDAPFDIALCSPDRLAEIPDQSLDLVVNVDSIPEMPPEVGRNYLREIKRICRGKFLSINQEAQKQHLGLKQSRVWDMIRKEGGFQQLARYRHWMEQGYVEEIYSCSSQ